MKTLIVGYGNQGKKRKKILGKEFYASFDPYNKESDFNNINEIRSDNFDNVFLCTPDASKEFYINYFLDRGKHILVEKPLFNENSDKIKGFIKKAKSKNLVLYIAYNHRFEKNFIKMKNLIGEKKLGKIYFCRIFYGNGTSDLVKKNKWKNDQKGVLLDIGSHMLDLLIFWFNTPEFKNIKIQQKISFESKSPDYGIITMNINKIFINIEVSLCMWKNTFTCDLIGEAGSAHINSLCKWSDSEFIIRKRIMPSGLPIEKKQIIKFGDNTWKDEIKFFKKLINNRKRSYSYLEKEILINNTFNEIFKNGN
jgi:scyllo-inositol 2-dehydrogenase (NADP+)